MLPAGHPHAWEPAHADEHLDPAFRARFMPEGSRLVVTPDMTRLIEGTPDSLDDGLATLVSGDWGCGKTTLLRALAAVSDVHTVFVEIPEETSHSNEHWEILATEITGAPATGTVAQLRTHVQDYLMVVPTLLLVDEAQHLKHATLRQLRFLFTRPYPRFAIVLAGTQLNEHIAKEKSVSTRIDRRVTIRPRGRDRIVDLVRRSSPTLAATDRDLLNRIDDRYADGSWRSWAQIERKAARQLGHLGPLTVQVAEQAIRDRSGRDIDLSTPNQPPARLAGSQTNPRRGQRR